MKLSRIFKLQICFHTLDIFTIHVLSEIHQHYQLNNYTLVSIIWNLFPIIVKKNKTF
jgi:hypothetical protein